MTQNTKILLDTNILVYASNSDSQFYSICRDLLAKNFDFFITDRSLLEFYRVLTGILKISVDQALELINFYTNNTNYTILMASGDTNRLTFELIKDYQAKSGKVFDLNILAIAVENNIDILCTVNLKNFPKLPQIKILNPEQID